MIQYLVCPGRGADIGMSPSGKAPDFDSGISSVRIRPSQPISYGSLAQLVEQRPFKAWVQGSSPWRATKQAVLHHAVQDSLLIVPQRGLEHSDPTRRGRVGGAGLTAPDLYVRPFRGEHANESLASHQETADPRRGLLCLYGSGGGRPPNPTGRWICAAGACLSLMCGHIRHSSRKIDILTKLKCILYGLFNMANAR